MKKQILKTLVLSSILVWSIGCKKSNEITDNQTAVASRPLPVLTILSESGGKLHNQFLDAIASNPDFPHVTSEDKYNIIISEASSSGLDVSSVPTYDEVSAEASFSVGFTDYSGYIQTFHDDGLISDVELEYLNKINTILKTYYWDQSLSNRLKTLEAKVLANPLYTNREKELIVGTSIIGRYSSAYWKNVIEDSSNPWHNIVGATPSNPAPGLPRFLRDAYGYVVGFIGAGHSGGVIVGTAFSAENY